MVGVLLVEDDDTIADPLSKGLQREGFDIERVATDIQRQLQAAV